MKDFNVENTNIYLKTTHELLEKYGIPAESKWKIKYDTANRIVQLEEFIIPIYEENITDKNNDLKFAYIELYFDYTQQYTGTSIDNFMLQVEYKHKER